jgi:hypothetical protein
MLVVVAAIMLVVVVAIAYLHLPLLKVPVVPITNKFPSILFVHQAKLESLMDDAYQDHLVLPLMVDFSLTIALTNLQQQ